jgi:hypothetical protein
MVEVLVDQVAEVLVLDTQLLRLLERQIQAEVEVVLVEVEVRRWRLLPVVQAS